MLTLIPPAFVAVTVIVLVPITSVIVVLKLPFTTLTVLVEPFSLTVTCVIVGSFTVPASVILAVNWVFGPGLVINTVSGVILIRVETVACAGWLFGSFPDTVAAEFNTLGAPPGTM